MSSNDALYIAKLDLFRYNLAEIKFRNSTHIGSILHEVELFIESIDNFTEAIRAFNELESKFNSHKIDTCKFRLSDAKQKLLNKAGEGLVNLCKQPERYGESIVIYEKLLTLLKDA